MIASARHAYLSLLFLTFLPASALAQSIQPVTSVTEIITANTLKGRYEGDFFWEAEKEVAFSHHIMIINRFAKKNSSKSIFGGTMAFHDFDGEYDKVVIKGSLDSRTRRIRVAELTPPGPGFTTGTYNGFLSADGKEITLIWTTTKRERGTVYYQRMEKGDTDSRILP